MTAPETGRSFAAPAAPPWRAEPFRVFFPLAVVLGWVGVAPWLLYDLGLMATYSCLFHGLVQMEALLSHQHASSVTRSGRGGAPGSAAGGG